MKEKCQKELTDDFSVPVGLADWGEDTSWSVQEAGATSQESGWAGQGWGESEEVGGGIQELLTGVLECTSARRHSRINTNKKPKEGVQVQVQSRDGTLTYRVPGVRGHVSRRLRSVPQVLGLGRGVRRRRTEYVHQVSYGRLQKERRRGL